MHPTHCLPAIAARLACCVLCCTLLQILAGRSEKRQLGSRKGNTFSIAHFAAGGAEPELPEAAEAEAEPAAVDAKAFWAELLPEAVQAHEAAAGAAKEPEVSRTRYRIAGEQSQTPADDGVHMSTRMEDTVAVISACLCCAYQQCSNTTE
jgi:hypothetical protein